MRLLFLLLSLAASCRPTQTGDVLNNQDFRVTKRVTIIASTDFHGALATEPLETPNRQVVHKGGAEYLAAYVKILKSRLTEPVLLIDGGDLFTGPLASNMNEGATVTDFYNSLGYTAAAVGNHEFDYGPQAYEEQLPGGGTKTVDPSSPRPGKPDDPQGALKLRAAQALFPFLAINIVDSRTGQPPAWMKPSIVLPRDANEAALLGPIRVGIIGATSKSTPMFTNKLNLAGLSFAPNMAQLIRQEAERLRTNENVNYVVLTIHEGGSCLNNDYRARGDLSTCNVADGDIFKLLCKDGGCAEGFDFPPGLVDVVVAGHTHAEAIKSLHGGKLALLQPSPKGDAIAWATLEQNVAPRIYGPLKICGKVVAVDNERGCHKDIVANPRGRVEDAVFLGQRIVPDLQTTRIIEQALAKAKLQLDEKLLVSVRGQDRQVVLSDGVLARNYFDENNLGNFVADAMRSAGGADIALQNNGGLRADIPPRPHSGDYPLTYGSIYSVLPFDNRLAAVKVTGAQIRKLIEIGTSRTIEGYSWSGLTAKVCRGVAVEVFVNGTPLQNQNSYSLITSDFLAVGGSGFDKAQVDPNAVTILWDGDNMRDLVYNAIRSSGRERYSATFYNQRRLTVDQGCR